MAENLERLTEAGVIVDEKKLSDAERKVLQELEPDEVDMLVRMRKKLDDAIAEAGGGAAGFRSPEFQPSPNVIV